MYCITINDYSVFVRNYIYGVITYENVEFTCKIDEFLQSTCYISSNELAFARIAVLKSIMGCAITNEKCAFQCVFRFGNRAVVSRIVTLLYDDVLQVEFEVADRNPVYRDLSQLLINNIYRYNTSLSLVKGR